MLFASRLVPSDCTTCAEKRLLFLIAIKSDNVNEVFPPLVANVNGPKGAVK